MNLDPLIFNGLKINFLGDSITQGGDANGRYPEMLKHKFEAAKCNNVVTRNYGISGTRIARQHKPSPKPEHDMCFLDRVEKMDADVDIVVIFGGTNDFGHGDADFGDVTNTINNSTTTDDDEYTFCGAFNSLLKRIKAKFPTALIIVITPLHRKTECATKNDIGLPCHPLIDYIEAIKQICEAKYKDDIILLDLWNKSCINPTDDEICKKYAPDGLHPNKEGTDILANDILQCIKECYPAHKQRKDALEKLYNAMNQ